MALDPDIFFRGAALQQANAARTQQTIQSVFDRLAARRQKEEDLERQKATDYEGSAYRVLMAQQAGLQPDPQDLLRAQAWDKMQTTKIAIDPLTREPYSPQRSIFDGMTAAPSIGNEGFSTEDINAVMMAESGGNPLAVSPKGATGLMQIMPETGKSPGFGVAPLKDGSPQENMRMGADYLNAMNKTYGDKATALMAYNWGPGNVDKWIASGRDPNAVPKETRDYVAKILNRNPMAETKAGQMKRFESDVALGQKAEEANIGAAAKGAETYASEKAKEAIKAESKIPALDNMISMLENFGEDTVKRLPGGIFENIAAGATNIANKPNDAALAQAKLDSTLPLLMAEAKTATRGAGEGTFTDADQKIISDMFFNPNDSTSVKLEKYNTLLSIFKSAKARSEGKGSSYIKEQSSKPGFKYLGTDNIDDLINRYAE